jgi:transposase-like protein
MARRTRRKFNSDFKAKVVLEVLKERSTLEELARKYELHPNQLGTWKKEFINKASSVFESEDKASEGEKDLEALKEKLYSQIGQQKMEIEWLKKKLQ